MTLHISQPVLDTLVRHATHDYPNECCGILIGPPPFAQTREGWGTPWTPRRSVTEAYVDRILAGENIARCDRRTAYQIDWKTLLTAVRSVRQGPQEIIGFYHSHPDGRSRPSQRDIESAWVGYAYVIISMVDGSCTAVTGWEFSGLKCSNVTTFKSSNLQTY